MGNKFTTTTVSTSGAPDITFEFHGDTVRAELAGAKLYAEAASDDGADLRLTAADGYMLADIRVNGRADHTLTESVMAIGSALMWSHWRWVQSQQEAA